MHCLTRSPYDANLTTRRECLHTLGETPGLCLVLGYHCASRGTRLSQVKNGKLTGYRVSMLLSFISHCGWSSVAELLTYIVSFPQVSCRMPMMTGQSCPRLYTSKLHHWNAEDLAALFAASSTGMAARTWLVRDIVDIPINIIELQRCAFY